MSDAVKPEDKALILDFGGVISRTLFETHALSETALGLAAGTLTWQGPFAPETDALWQAMQADQISERDYWMQRTREVGRLLGEDWTEMQTFVQRARGADVQAVIRPEAVAAIQQAKALGYKLGILSNELDLFYGADFRERLPLLQQFDVIVDATYTAILKPDPRAYDDCLQALGVRPELAVFVDDQKRNVDGARRCGLQVVQLDVCRPGAGFSEAMRLLMSL
ncbi:MAG: HAD-IA family hydrolase [Limnohabitans sp.]|jgi:putative hydrolase of the HAD superfamily|uniref:HAD-IA family hydrolase n=1 Tax=Limnohabitans sp. TaxID=1907725 RepID=UPI0025D28E45|nr:HAD-IA family hydrolase [Limnohabitans sp.]MCO4088328.1 HAD-IA family hydrolase [Limnohabitans sp.]